MSTAQIHTFREFLFENIDDIEEFHHGVCVGADTQAHLLVYDVFSSFMDDESIGTVIHYHPPTNIDKMSDLRAFPGVRHRPRPYLDRNHDIVDACDILFAAPYQDGELLRSGTWATIRYARKTHKTIKQLRRMGGYIG